MTGLPVISTQEKEGRQEMTQSEITVKEGVHFSFGREVITLIKNGIPFERSWDSDMQLEPYLLDALLDDMGIGEGDELRPEPDKQKALARQAVRNYFALILEEWGGPGNLDIGDAKAVGFAFYSGYLAALNSTIIPLLS